MEFDIDLIELKMEEAIESLDRRLSKIRAGRANPNMFSSVKVEAYGSTMNLNEVANITVPSAREIFIKPFDKSLLKNIDRGINEANLGINPTNNGEFIIINLPELTMDKRQEYVKESKKVGEDAKIALRNIRQTANQEIKKEELAEDKEKALLNDVQELINKYNKIVEDVLSDKEEELMTI